MQAVRFGIDVLLLAVAAWAYFDASDRGIRWGWVWALATLLLMPSIVGAAFVLLVSGAATAMTSALAYAVSEDSFSSNQFRDMTASALSALVVGALVWWPHWVVLSRRVAPTGYDQQFRALYALRRTGLLLASFASSALAVLSTLCLVGGGISAALAPTYAAAIRWLPALRVLVAAGAAAAAHAQSLHRSASGPPEARFRAVPLPVRPAPVRAVRVRPAPAAAAPPPSGPRVRGRRRLRRPRPPRSPCRHRRPRPRPSGPSHRCSACTAGRKRGRKTSTAARAARVGHLRHD